MADIVGDQLKLLNAEAADVTQQLARINAELLSATLPLEERLGQLERQQQMLFNEKELANKRRSRLVALAAGAPPCARACTLAVFEL